MKVIRHYWIARNGQTLGPYLWDQVRELWKNGQITSADQLCSDENQNWRPVDQFIESLRDKPSPKRKSGILRTIILLLVITVAVVWVMSYSDQSPSPASPPVNARVSISEGAVHITNLDSFDWNDTTVYLNGNPLTGYKCNIVPVKAGKTVSVPLRSFCKGDLRFDPIARTVNEVMVHEHGHDAPIYKFR